MRLVLTRPSADSRRSNTRPGVDAGHAQHPAAAAATEPKIRPNPGPLILDSVQGVFSFPNPVNEKAARVVAGVVFVTAVVILVTGAYWLLIPLAYGFWARVLTGPTLSPLGWAAQNVVAPRLGARKPVAGAPKRFAQGMGAAMATVALICWLVVGSHTATDVLLGLFVVAAGLESIFAVCLGCRVFAHLMRVGLVPESVCLECADISRRLRTSQPGTSS